MSDSEDEFIGTSIGDNRVLTIPPSGQPGQVCICDHLYEGHYITFGGESGCSYQQWGGEGVYACLCDGFVRE